MLVDPLISDRTAKSLRRLPECQNPTLNRSWMVPASGKARRQKYGGKWQYSAPNTEERLGPAYPIELGCDKIVQLELPASAQWVSGALSPRRGEISRRRRHFPCHWRSRSVPCGHWSGRLLRPFDWRQGGNDPRRRSCRWDKAPLPHPGAPFVAAALASALAFLFALAAFRRCAPPPPSPPPLSGGTSPLNHPRC